MKLSQTREYQTVRLFAILGFLTLMIVMLFKVVLFAPQSAETLRLPAQNVYVETGINPRLIKPAAEK